MSLADYALSNGTNQQTGIANAFVAATGGTLIVPPGTWRLDTGGVVIPDGTDVIFMGKGAKFDYRGTGAAFEIRNSKNISIQQFHVDLTNAGANAIGLWVRGCWFLDLYTPRVFPALPTHIGILIETSQTGGQNHGSFCINIYDPDMTGTGGSPGLYGIQTVQTAGDTVVVTHFQTYNGWLNSFTDGTHLRNLNTFRIEGTTCEACVDGIDMASCAQGILSPGELSGNTGYGINFGAGCAGITLNLPSNAGNGGALGFMNNTTYTPQIFNQGQVRLYGSSTDQTYYADIKSAFNAGKSFVVEVKGGSVAREIWAYDETGGSRFLAVGGISGSGSVLAKNLGGQETFATAATKAVTFAIAEPDTNYRIIITGNANETFFWSALGTGGFTLNSSNAVSVAIVNWFLFRN